MTGGQTFEELLIAAEQPVLHLEMRDGYMRSDPEFIAWQQGVRYSPTEKSSWWRPWLDTISNAVAHGVEIRRARIVSEPIREYIRFEYDNAFTNIAAGEEIRWLPRYQASRLMLPVNDFWLIDDLVSFNHFAGDGEVSPLGYEDIHDEELAHICRAAFENVWKLATPHALYKPS